MIYSAPVLKLDLDLSRHLLQVQDHEFSRFERRKPDHDVHDPEIAIVLSCRLGVALHKVRVLRFLALESALPKEVLHKGADIQPDLRVQRLVIRFENYPFETAIQALFYEQRQAANRNVLIFTSKAVIAIHRACAPVDDAVRKDTYSVHGSWVQDAVLVIGKLLFHADDAAQIGLDASRGFPNSARPIDAGTESGDCSGRTNILLETVLVDGQRREEDRAVVLDQADSQQVDANGGRLRVGP